MADTSAGGVALGLELKARYAAMLLSGEKTVELRRYPIPPAYLGRPVLLLATPDGNEGVSTLPDDLPEAHPGVHVAGTVVFSRQIEYTSFEQFAADEALHRVPPVGTPYGWVQGTTKVLYGWVVSGAEPARPGQGRGRMRRVFSSWFEGAGPVSPMGSRLGPT